MNAQIVIQAGPEQNKIIRLIEPEVIIGRASESTIQLNDKKISRQHLKIEMGDNQFRLTDLGSRYGTLVNQLSVTQAILNHGDLILIGNCLLRFEFLNPVSEATAAAVAPSAAVESDQFLTVMQMDPDALARIRQDSVEELRRATNQLKSLVELSTILQGDQGLDDVLRVILDRIYLLFSPDRAYILLIDSESGELVPGAAKFEGEEVRRIDEIPISRTICSRVIESHEAVITSDASSDLRFKAGQSIQSFSIRSAMCVPIVHDQKTLGVVYLDIREDKKCYTDNELLLLMGISGTVSSAVSIAMLRDKNREHEKIRDNLSRFFSPAIVEEVVSSRGEAALQGERREISVFFLDLRGFTELARNHEVENIVYMLNKFFTMAVRNIFEEQGTLDKFLGDGIMALFGAPVDQPDCHTRAVSAAVKILSEMRGLNASLESEGLPALNVGIAVTTGAAIVGTLGSHERLEYTAIGSVVNLSARLCALAEGGKILIDEQTAHLVQSEFDLECMGQTQIKGISDPITYYEVSGPK